MRGTSHKKVSLCPMARATMYEGPCTWLINIEHLSIYILIHEFNWTFESWKTRETRRGMYFTGCDIYIGCSVVIEHWQNKLCLPPPPPPPSSMLWTTPKQLFGNIPWYKLNIELGERVFKNGNMIQHGVYQKNTRIFYRGKIVSSSYVQDCLNVGFLHAYQLFESYG
jgi:hypothetical protein